MDARPPALSGHRLGGSGRKELDHRLPALRPASSARRAAADAHPDAVGGKRSVVRIHSGVPIQTFSVPNLTAIGRRLIGTLRRATVPGIAPTLRRAGPFHSFPAARSTPTCTGPCTRLAIFTVNAAQTANRGWPARGSGSRQAHSTRSLSAVSEANRRDALEEWCLLPRRFAFDTAT